MEQHLGAAASVQAIQAGQPTTLDTLTVGADIYEVDGVGANINFALGGSAELTLDALLAAAVASGTENLFWDKLSATRLRIRSADAPQGNIIGSDPSIVLDASSMTNWTFDAGDVNMNTLSGKAAGQRQKCVHVLTITTALIAGSPIRLACPFTPTAIDIDMRTAAGAKKIASVDTFVITGDDIVVTLGGAGTDLANTDILTLTCYD
jgi:hypothetical protein